MSVLRLAVIGAGSWGRNHIRAVAANPEAELAAVCDLNPDRLTAVQQQYPSILVTEDLDTALQNVDAAVIATSAATHAELATSVLERGLPVLVEKPFALSVRDAEAVAKLADDVGVPVLVGHLLLFHPAIQRLKSLLHAGDLGNIYYLYGQRVNLGQLRPDENALWSYGPHDVSITLDLLNELPTKIVAQGRSYIQHGIEDVVFLTMEFASGIIAHVQMSWLDPHKERRLTVVGSKKMVVFDDMQPREKLKVYDRGVDRPPEYRSYGESLSIREGDMFSPRVPNLEPLTVELAHFLAAVRGEEPVRVSAADGVAVVRVLESATASLRAGGTPIDLSPVNV